MKKILALFLVAIMMISLGACGGDTPAATDDSGKTVNTDNPVSTTGTTAATDTTATAGGSDKPIETNSLEITDFDAIESFEDIPVISEKNKWILKRFIEEIDEPGVVLNEDKFFSGKLRFCTSKVSEAFELFSIECDFNQIIKTGDIIDTDSGLIIYISSFFVGVRKSDFDKIVEIFNDYFADMEYTQGNSAKYSIDMNGLTQTETDRIHQMIHVLTYKNDTKYREFSDEWIDKPIPEETTATGTTKTEIFVPVVDSSGLVNFKDLGSFEDIPAITAESKELFIRFLQTAIIDKNEFLVGAKASVNEDNAFYGSLRFVTDTFNFSSFTSSFITYYVNTDLPENVKENMKVSNVTFTTVADQIKLVEILTEFFGDRATVTEEEQPNNNRITYSVDTANMTEEEISKLHQIVHTMTYKSDTEYKAFVDEHFAE